LLRSRSDCCLALRASFAPIRSFELGVPESVLSIPRRRSSSASGDLRAVHIRAGRRKGLRTELPGRQDGLF